MTVPRLIVALTLAVICAASPASAQDARRLELARSIVEQGYPPESRVEVFGGAMTQISDQLLQTVSPDLRENAEVMELLVAFQDKLISHGKAVMSRHIDTMMDGLAHAYAAEFSTTELESLHAYVASAEGHGFLARSAGLISDPAYASASQAYLEDYMAGVPQLRDQFIKELTHLLMEQDQGHHTES